MTKDDDKMKDMTRETIEELETRMDSDVNAVRSEIYSLKEALDAFEERIDNALDILNTWPNEELNALLAWGVIPGAIVIYDGKRTLKFDGFTSTMRMNFMDISNHEETTASISGVYKNLDKFKKAEG